MYYMQVRQIERLERTTRTLTSLYHRPEINGVNLKKKVTRNVKFTKKLKCILSIYFHIQEDLGKDFLLEHLRFSSLIRLDF